MKLLSMVLVSMFASALSLNQSAHAGPNARVSTHVPAGALAADAPNPIYIGVPAFTAEVAVKRFDAERFVLTIDCQPASASGYEGYVNWIQLDVKKVTSRLYTATNPAENVFLVKPDAGDCLVSFSAFKTVNHMTTRVDVSLYGTTLSGQQLSKRDIVGDLNKRLKNSKIVGMKSDRYPFFNGDVLHKVDPTDSFCVQVLGRAFSNPNSASLSKTLKFDEMPSYKQSFAGKLMRKNGHASFYFRCHEANRSVELEVADLDRTDDNVASEPSKKLTATFNQDLTVMNLNDGAWKLAPARR
ncbi:MAG: hypothetical protein EOP05_20155 [Proteobacteria bacterium]|nr:MAG: hypothetical protein EOP05_20155 [Pseudomonadota bacterium]